jgi:COMPASS component BRE2
MGGQKVHMSRPVDFLPPASSGETQHFVEGDVLGLEISLPPLSLHQKIVSGDYNPAVDSPSLPVPPHEPAPDIIRDRVPIHYKSNLYFESYEYHATKELEELTHPSPHPTTTSASSSSASQPPNPTHPSVHLRTLPGSYIKVYRNGRSIGKPFENLLAFLPPASKPQNIGSGAQAREGLDDGLCGYFPAVSVFKSGAAECNFGPDWWCPPDESPQDQDRDHEGDVDMDAASQTMRKAVAERYDEQIAEDVVWDIIDEVDFWLQDGAASRVAAAGATIGGSLTQPVAASKGVAAAPGAASCVSANRRPTAIPSLDGAADEVAFADTSGDLTMNTISSAVPAGVALTQPVIPGSSTALEDGTTDEIKELIQEDE